MNLPLIVDVDAQESALQVARKVHLQAVSRSEGLPTFAIDDVMTWAEKVWDSVEQALRDAYGEGLGAARLAIEAVVAKMEEAASSLGDRLTQLEEVLRQRLDAYLQSLIDNAFSRLRPAIKVGDRELFADGATIQQSIKFTGSVKAKLDEICSFVAENQLQVSVSYKAVG